MWSETMWSETMRSETISCFDTIACAEKKSLKFIFHFESHAELGSVFSFQFSRLHAIPRELKQ